MVVYVLQLRGNSTNILQGQSPRTASSFLFSPMSTLTCGINIFSERERERERERQRDRETEAERGGGQGTLYIRNSGFLIKPSSFLLSLVLIAVNSF